MLRRIQSLLLLMAGIAALLTLYYPTYTDRLSTTSAQDSINGLSYLPLTIITILVAVFSFADIFLYKNRNQQIKVAAITMLLEVINMLVYYLEIKNHYASGQFQLSALLHIIILLFLFLAIQAIKKDQQMLKSSNRLR